MAVQLHSQLYDLSDRQALALAVPLKHSCDGHYSREPDCVRGSHQYLLTRMREMNYVFAG